jgi:hypothetical protein
MGQSPEIYRMSSGGYVRPGRRQHAPDVPRPRRERSRVGPTPGRVAILSRSRARTSSRPGQGGPAIARGGRIGRPVRRPSDQQPWPRRDGGRTTREICIRVPASTGAFLVPVASVAEPVGTRQAGRTKVEAEQARERTRTCVSETRRPTTPARSEIAGAH